MNKEERKPVVKELAAELYKVRTGAEEAPVNKITQQDYHMALVSLLFFQKREQLEYGVTFSVNGKDSVSFPDTWHPRLMVPKTIWTGTSAPKGSRAPNVCGVSSNALRVPRTSKNLTRPTQYSKL